MGFFRPIVAAAIVIMIGGIGCASRTTSANESDPTATVIPSVTPEWFVHMTPTIWPPLTETPYPMITATHARDTSQGSGDGLAQRITDGHGSVMMLIPEGEFTMGSDTGYPDEKPVHQVWVNAFYIDLVEVTNKEYKECVDTGACKPPHRSDCCTEDPNRFVIWPEYFGNPEFDNYPVIFISWYDANDYCTWRDARLATEAEWEKASRGTDARTYPWGNNEPTPDLLNFLWPQGDFGGKRPLYTTAPVGSYPAGASPYGVLDLAGNVYEWLWDRYDPHYFENSPYENPQGPDEGEYRLTRGGSFWNQAFRNRSANRNNAYIPAASVHFDGGARCAVDVPK